MSITINTEPNALHTGFNPVTWGVSSDRNTQREFVVSNVTNNGSGFAKYTTSNPTTAPAIQVGDVMLPDVSVSDYNVLQTVTGITTSSITTDASYTTSGAAGKIKRTNNNFKIKASVAIKNSEYYDGTCTFGSGTATYTSATLIAGENIATGNYVLCTGFATSSLNGLKKISSISGNNFVIDETIAGTGTAVSGKIMLMKIAGALYGQSPEVSESSNVSFDISNIINPYLSEDFITLGQSNIQSATGQGSIKPYAVRFEEMFENKDGLLTAITTTLEGDSKQVVNAANQDYETATMARFDLDGTSKEFLTEIPNDAIIHIDQEIQLSFITQVTSVHVGYRKYNLSGVAGSWLDLADVTPENAIETYFRGSIPVSSNTIFDSSTSKVEVRLENAGGAAISETKTFVIDNKCYNNEVVLEFKNRYGGIDSYTYIVTNNTNANIERGFSRNAGTKSTNHVNSSRLLTLEGRNEHKNTFEWLERLYESKEVYMVDSRYSAGRVKVNLTDRDYTLNSQELFTSIIEIESQEPKLN